MSKPIKNKANEIWNERFGKRMEELGLSQRKFIEKYRNRFGTGSQSDVSNWMHIGEKDGKSRNPRKFPEFKTMKQIAEILEVSVGYLIGETDYETFEMERASKYLGLSPSAIKAIRDITSGKAIPPFHKYSDPRITSALELLLSTHTLVDYLENIEKIAERMNALKNPRDYYDDALKRIPEAFQEDALALNADPEDAVCNKGVVPTNELWAYTALLDDAQEMNMYQYEFTDRDIKALRYALQEINSKMMDEILTEKGVDTILKS